MSAVPQPTTEQLVTAFVAALAPLAGPYGVLASGVITAAESLIDQIKNQGGTMVDLETIAAKTGADLATLQADLAASKEQP